jgi:hypothetical protein
MTRVRSSSPALASLIQQATEAVRTTAGNAVGTEARKHARMNAR